jgi:hypothetical protein
MTDPNTPTSPIHAEINLRFAYRSIVVDGDQEKRMERVAHAFHECAMTVVDIAPSTVDRDLAIDWMDTAMQWALASIAREPRMGPEGSCDTDTKPKDKK